MNRPNGGKMTIFASFVSKYKDFRGDFGVLFGELEAGRGGTRWKGGTTTGENSSG